MQVAAADDRAGLVASRVSKVFGGLRAVESVDLGLRQGEILGLIGPNGSGKTTLLNLLSGVIPPTGGRVSIDGLDVTGWPPHRIAGAGLGRTFQSIRLFRRLSVLENIEVGVALGRGRGGPRNVRAEARRLLARFGLSSLERRDASTLPYGAQRRLEIARAIAGRPAYLLLDEPAAGMNEAESDELLETIGRMRAEYPLGAMVIDHDLRLIMRLCDRVMVLNEGVVIAAGTPGDVRSDPVVIEAYLGTASHG